MKIIMLGISYQTAPIEIREQVSFSNRKLEQAYNELKNIEGIEEALIINTCNRTEIYAYIPGEHSKDVLLDFIVSFHKLENNIRKSFYQYEDNQAVEHLYRVALGLNSMVVGEDQILGQVKEAYEKAMDMDMIGKVLNTLFRYVITSAKTIRHEVMGNNPPISVSSIAVQFLKKQYTSIEKKTVFVLGVGKMSTITIQNLIAENVQNIFVANRTKHKAKQLQTYFPQIKVVPYEKRLEVMAECDIIISSTSAPHYIITKEMFVPFYKGKKICFIDLSLPRDIEPELSEVKGITVFTLDNLKQVSEENIEKRKEQAKKAEKRLEIEIQKFWDWYICQPVVPTISHLQQYYTEISNEEIKSLMSRLEHLDEKDRKLIYKVSKSMARKLFNIPIHQIKKCAKGGNGQMVSKVIEDLFELPRES